MKIKYQFADGTQQTIDVPEEYGALIIESRKAEHARDEKERYHCYSYDSAEYEGMEYADENTPESIYDAEILSTELATSLTLLTEKQRRRLIMYADGLSYREIARREGVSDHKKIIQSVDAARKKIKAFLSK